MNKVFYHPVENKYIEDTFDKNILRQLGIWSFETIFAIDSFIGLGDESLKEQDKIFKRVIKNNQLKPFENAVVNLWWDELHHVMEASVQSQNGTTLKLDDESYQNLLKPLPEDNAEKMELCNQYYKTIRRVEWWRSVMMNMDVDWNEIYDVIQPWFVHYIDSIHQVYLDNREAITNPFEYGYAAKGIARICAVYLEYAPEPNRLERMARKLGKFCIEAWSEYGPWWLQHVGGKVNVWTQRTSIQLREDEDPGVIIVDTNAERSWIKPNNMSALEGTEEFPEEETVEKSPWNCKKDHKWNSQCPDCLSDYP